MAKKTSTALTCIVFASLLAGCSANSINTHASIVDHSDLNGKGTYYASHAEDYERSNRLRPKSDHVSLFGDKSKKFLVAGQEHFKAQNYGLAESNFRKAVETRSDSASAWLGLAASLDQLGKFGGADRAYDQLAQLKGNNARVLNNRGYSFLLRGDYQRARQYLNRAQEMDPTLEEIQGNI
ncbi:MAG: tetratricopeptide repeat protein, partial [Pseudomonadota bacterium]